MFCHLGEVVRCHMAKEQREGREDTLGLCCANQPLVFRSSAGNASNSHHF